MYDWNVIYKYKLCILLHYSQVVENVALCMPSLDIDSAFSEFDPRVIGEFIYHS